MTHSMREAHPGRLPLSLLLLSLLAPAQAQEGGAKRSIYPEAPATPPPPIPVEGADASEPAAMQAYLETIPGTRASFRMVPVPAGSFLLGSPADEADRKADEGPQRSVEIEAFWIEEHEVTWDEYHGYMLKLDLQERSRGGAEAVPQDAWADAVSRPTPPYRPMDFEMGVEGYPAVCMTQFAARQYTKWLSMKTGRFYRLPSEAEWEYACRAGTSTPYSFEDPAALADHAWFFDNSDGKYQKVMRKKPNPWGLFDMHGNVSEWVLDRYDAGAYAALPEQGTRSPVAWPSDVYPHVVRGGSWDDDADRLRSAARRASNKSWKVQDPQLPKSIWYHTDAPWVGFRVIRPLRVPPPEEQARYWDPDCDVIREVYEKQRTGSR